MATTNDLQCCNGEALTADQLLECQARGYLPGNKACGLLTSIYNPLETTPGFQSSLNTTGVPMSGVVFMSPRAAVMQTMAQPHGRYTNRGVILSPRYVLQSRSPMVVPSAPYRPMSPVPPKQILSAPVPPNALGMFGSGYRRKCKEDYT